MLQRDKFPCPKKVKRMICVCLETSELKSSQSLKENVKANVTEAVGRGDMGPGSLLRNTMLLTSFEPITASLGSGSDGHQDTQV